jgi:hypothetical protein
MSTADALIAGLRNDAQFDSEGSFSLDRDRAREKMRQFQLADPHRYVLLLVEAAILRGASAIDFHIDADDMRMSFDAALEWEDLDELYASLFVDRSTVSIRARRELALACNAVMALNPRWVRIESWAAIGGGPVTGVRALLRPDAEDEIERVEQAPPDARAPLTTIHVKERFRPGLLVRFLHNIADALPEEELLRQRCAMASIPITLDGKPISFGLPRTALAGVSFEAEGLRGVAGINLDDRKRSTLVLLSNGVELVTTTLRDSVPGLWFWVDASNLRKDVSQSDVVSNDESYLRMLSALATPRDRVLARLVELWSGGQLDTLGNFSSGDVFDLLRSCFLRWADHQWLAHDAGALGKLADMPLWRTVDHRWLSPRELSAQADPERGIMYTTRDYSGVVPLGWGPVIHAYEGPGEVEAIRRVYPHAAHDATTQLEREVPWERNRRRWLGRSHPPTLPAAVGPATAAITTDTIIGQARIVRPGIVSNVRIIVDGCLLCELTVDVDFLGVSAVLAGPFTPLRDYSRPRHDRTLATAALLLLGQLPRMITAWIEHEGESAAGELRRVLAALSRPSFAADWLQSFGFAEQTALQMVARLGAPRLLPALGLDSNEPTYLAHVPLFDTIDGRRVSLVDLNLERRGRAREPGKLLVIDRSVISTNATAPELLVHADADERRLLAAVFGAAAIHDDTYAYMRDVGRRSFLARPQAQPALPPSSWQVIVDRPRIRGVVGIDPLELRRWQASQPRNSTIEVIVEGRLLTTLHAPAWLPGVAASLIWDDAPVNRSWDGLDDAPGTTMPLLHAVNTALLELIRARAEAAIELEARPDDDVRRLLWLAMSSPFIATEFAAAWRKFRAQFELAAAIDGYMDLAQLITGLPIQDVREAITLLLEDNMLPTRQAVLILLMRKEPPRHEVWSFQRGVLELYELLERVLLLENTAGTPVSLATLNHHVAATDEIAYVDDLALRFHSHEHLIIRAHPIDHVALHRLFDAKHFNEVSAWIHERAHQQRFATQAQLSAIRLADHDRLVGVEFERDGVTGELAIPPWMPNDSGDMKLTYCHDRRVVQEIGIHAALPVLGILDDPEADLSADYSRVNTTGVRMYTIRKLLDEVLAEQLLPALAKAFPTLDASRQSVARGWILVHWHRTSPRAGQHPNRLSAAGREFAALKLFVDVDQTPRSLTELSERFAEHKTLWYVERDLGHPDALPFPVVLMRPQDHRLLHDLFDPLEDFTRRWNTRIASERRRRRAPDLPGTEAPADALVRLEVDRHGLRGTLWLPAAVPFDAGVTLGADGKVLAVHHPLDELPIMGVVDGVTADDRFVAPELNGAQTRYLSARAISAYGALLNHHRADLERPDRPDFNNPEQVRLRAVRIELLRGAAISLAHARRRGRSFDAILGNLERRLSDEPLLRLATGRLISVELALQARPPEFAHFDIWDPKEPTVSARVRERLLSDTVEPEPEIEIEPAPEVESEELIDLEGMLGLSFDEPEQVLERLLDFDEPASTEPPVKIKPPRDLVAELLERVREELRMLREQHQIVLAEGLLDCISADIRNGRELVRIEDGVVFDSRHPRFVRAMDDPDPIWVSFLASVAYTAINRWLDEITDAHEQVFHHRHAEYLLSGFVDG